MGGLYSTYCRLLLGQLNTGLVGHALNLEVPVKNITEEKRITWSILPQVVFGFVPFAAIGLRWKLGCITKNEIPSLHRLHNQKSNAP